MVQETLAAMRATIITEDNLVAVVHELSNRFPLPGGESEDQGMGQAANSMGPLYTTASPSSQYSSQFGSPMVASGMSPMKSGMGAGDEGFAGDESDSTDSEDDMGDLRLLGLAQ